MKFFVCHVKQSVSLVNHIVIVQVAIQETLQQVNTNYTMKLISNVKKVVMRQLVIQNLNLTIHAVLVIRIVPNVYRIIQDITYIIMRIHVTLIALLKHGNVMDQKV